MHVVSRPAGRGYMRATDKAMASQLLAWFFT